jgi:hypothetical protein
MTVFSQGISSLASVNGLLAVEKVWFFEILPENLSFRLILQSMPLPLWIASLNSLKTEHCERVSR